MKEIFKGYYSTKDGNIYSSKSKKFLSQRLNRRGYKLVNLSIDGKCKTFSVHRLIAKAFIPNPQNLPEINHKDGNKTNNCIENLEWINSKDNVTHSLVNGLSHPARGLDTKNGKFNKEDILKIRELAKSGYSQREIAKMFKVTRGAIQQIIKRKTYSYI